MDKFISIDEAASLITDHSLLALGGLTLYRRPVAFVKALLRRRQMQQSPNDIALLAFTAGFESDLLVGSGMVSQVRTCYFGMEIFGLAPMFTYFAGRGDIKVIEETEASLALGIRAAMAGIGFMPGRAWIGTDLPKLRPDVKMIQDPYLGESLMAFPAIHPDIAVIHALRADSQGNITVGDNKGIDLELAVVSKTVLVTTEEIVPKLTKADIVAPLITAIIHAPQGASPTSCHPLYPLDGNQLMDYTNRVADPVSFDLFIRRFITG